MSSSAKWRKRLTPAPVAGAGHFDGTVNLIDGANPIHVAAIDRAGNTGTADALINRYSIPEITITSPADLTWATTTTIDISGTISDPNATIDVQGTPATVSANTWVAQNVPLLEGGNFITAVATDSNGHIGTATVRVLRDVTPPHVAIDYPADGALIGETTVNVSGLVNDIVLGTVNGEQASVSVNGIAATVSNRTFLATAVPLTPGANTITAGAVDRNGNTNSVSITVTQQNLTGLQLHIVAGDVQLAAISTELPDPVVVSLEDGAGQPLLGGTVIFKVLQNNGTVRSGSSSGRLISATTDSQGKASFRWTLGSRAGAGNNVVEASSPGITGTLVLHASGGPGTPAQISLDAGANQFGVAGRPLPRPFVAVLTDVGHNRLRDFPVTFTVKAGGGAIGGQTAYTMNTDTDGRAVAVLTLGPDEGIANNIVEADFAGNTGLPVRFTANAQIAGDPAATKISGVVLDNTNAPIPGVTLRIDETSITTQADEQGQFAIQPAPVGRVKLIADGSTATRPGNWPTLEYEMVTVAGNNNTIGMPIYLLPIDLAQGLYVDETQGGTIALPDVPGFSLTIKPGSATFPDGSHKGTVSVTMVHPDKVPMTPNFGQQPRFIVTIQPAGVRFDPPAPMTLPNVDGLGANEITEMYSFDHDLSSFVAIGTGSVTDDGSTLRSDNGVGIVKGGWHCGGNPSQTCNAGPLYVTILPPTLAVPIQTALDLKASGGITPNNDYIDWEIFDDPSNPDDRGNVATIQASSSCPGDASCPVTIIGHKPGLTSMRVSMRNQTTGDVAVGVPATIPFKVPARVESITFKGGTSIWKDDGSGTYPNEFQWKDANGNGRANDVGDNDFPLLYISGSTLRLEAVIKFDKPIDFPTDFVIKGDGPEGTHFETSADGFDLGDSTTVIFQQSLTFPQDNTIRFYPSFSVEWKISFDGGPEEKFGLTTNRLYVLPEDPADPNVLPKLYETVLDLACRKNNGSKNDGDPASTTIIVNNIWDVFKSRKVRNATEEYKEHKKENEGLMSFWKRNDPKLKTVIQLMTRGDGTCFAWAELFMKVLRVHSIASQIVEITPIDEYESPLSYDKNMDFTTGQILFKNWKFTGFGSAMACREKGFRWVFSDDPVLSEYSSDQTSSHPAQGNDGPPRAFFNHRFVDYNGMYYDPSYGVIESEDLVNYENDQVDGFEIMCGNTNRQAKKNEESNAELKVQPVTKYSDVKKLEHLSGEKN